MKTSLRSILLTAALAVAVPALTFGAISTRVRNNLKQALPGQSDAVDEIVNASNDANLIHRPVAATFTVATKSGNNIDTQVVFKDGRGSAIATVFKTYCWESPATTGLAYITTANTAAFSAVTYGSVESRTSGKSADVLSDASGRLGIRSTQSSGTSPTEYLCCALAGGATACSGAIAFH